jgi:cytochrome b561
MNNPVRYNNLAIALHWVLAVALVYQIALGLWMVGIPKSPPGLRAEWFNWHKSIGLSLGLAIVLRGLWRLKSGAPSFPAGLPAWQTSLANINHVLLYGCMVLMPLSGLLGSMFSPYPIKFFGIVMPKLLTASPPLKELMSTLHFVASRVFMFAISLHILAAIWHLLKGDDVFARMMPGKSEQV